MSGRANGPIRLVTNSASGCDATTGQRVAATSPGRYPRRVIPFAVSGISVIGAAVGGAVLLVWILLRMEARDEAADERAKREGQ